jgi:ADP-heptose:LPS heptosyltransferase
VLIDCRHFSGALPCTPHKRDGRTCDRCGDYEPVAHRLLIVKLAAAGDVLRTTCILPALRDAWPGAQITWVTERGAIPLLEDNPLIDRIVARQDAIERLMVERFDVGFGLDPDEQGGALMAIARCRERFGYALDDRGRVMPLNDGAAAWWRLGLDDAAKRANRRTFQDLLFETCGLSGAAARPQIVVPDVTRRVIEARFRVPLAPYARVVLLNTGGGGRWAQKKWTPARYVEFARRLRSEQPDTAVLVAGGPEESALHALLLASLDDPGIVDAGCDNSLKAFAAIVELADLVVTSDSLALHIATALSRPVVALVGPTSPWELEMYGSGEVVTANVPCVACYRRECDKPVTCMERLTPHEVYDACLRVAAVDPVRRDSRCNLGA